MERRSVNESIASEGVPDAKYRSRMDVISNIINGALLLITAIGTIIAWYQANQAIKARNDASRSLAAAESSATAAGRSAAALERVADATDRSLSGDPWQVRPAGKHRWSVTNISGLNVDFVLIESVPPHVIQPEQADHVDVANGGSIYFQFGGGATDPTSANVTVKWRSPVSKMQESFHFSVP